MKTPLLRTKQGSECLWFLSQRNLNGPLTSVSGGSRTEGAMVRTMGQGRTRRPAQALNLGGLFTFS